MIAMHLGRKADICFSKSNDESGIYQCDRHQRCVSADGIFQF